MIKINATRRDKGLIFILYLTTLSNSCYNLLAFKFVKFSILSAYKMFMSAFFIRFMSAFFIRFIYIRTLISGRILDICPRSVVSKKKKSSGFNKSVLHRHKHLG